MCELLHTSAWCATARDRWSQGKKWITLPLLLPGCGTATEVLRCRKLTRCAISGCERMQHRAQVYSITSSATLSRDGGTVRPIMRAVSALITSSMHYAKYIARRDGTEG